MTGRIVDSGKRAEPDTDGVTRTALLPKEQALWLFQKFTPDLGVLNVALAFRLPGRLRWWPLHAALGQLVRRHPALRSRFPEIDGVPMRARYAAADDRVEPSVRTVAATADTLDDRLRALAAEPFDMETELPLRVIHLRGPEVDVVCLVAHHLAADRVSMNVIMRELVELYGSFSRSADVPAALAGEVPDYVERPTRAEDLAYWRDLFATRPAGGPLRLGARPDPAERRSFRGRTTTYQLSAAGTRALGALAQSLRATRNIVLLAAYALILGRHGVGPEPVVGLVIDAREPRGANAVGYHITMLAQRFDLAARSSFADLVGQTRKGFLLGASHGSVGIDDVLPGSYESTTPGAEPLFRYMFNYLSAELTSWAAEHGVRLVDLPRPTSRLDIELTAIDHGADVMLHLTHADELFDEDEIGALARRLDAVLQRAADAPDMRLAELSVWTPGDRDGVPRSVPGGILDRPDVPEARIAVLDAAGLELPPGVWGEVALQDPATDGGRQRTGRSGRWRFDGTLEVWPAANSGSAPDRSPDPTEVPGEQSPTDPELLDFLLAQWRELLGKPDAGEDDHFFRNSGTSLQAGRLVARIKKQLGIKLSLRDVFRAPTPAGLARVVATARDESTSA